MTREIEADPVKLFERWYVRPLRELEKLPEGDGGFVVLATCCFLYERYAKAYLRDSGGEFEGHIPYLRGLGSGFCLRRIRPVNTSARSMKNALPRGRPVRVWTNNSSIRSGSE